MFMDSPSECIVELYKHTVFLKFHIVFLLYIRPFNILLKFLILSIK